MEEALKDAAFQLDELARRRAVDLQGLQRQRATLPRSAQAYEVLTAQIAEAAADVESLRLALTVLRNQGLRTGASNVLTSLRS